MFLHRYVSHSVHGGCTLGRHPHSRQTPPPPIGQTYPREDSPPPPGHSYRNAFLYSIESLESVPFCSHLTLEDRRFLGRRDGRPSSEIKYLGRGRVCPLYPPKSVPLSVILSVKNNNRLKYRREAPLI